MTNATRRALDLAALLLLLAACGTKAPVLPALAAGDVVLAFGDSLTFGTGANESESYPAILASLIGRSVIREGVPGETTEQGLERLPQALEMHHPRLVLLCLGGNDMLRKVDEATTEANLRQMVQTVRASGAALVLIGVPRPALFAGTAPLYLNIAKDLQVPLERTILADVLHDNALKSDAIHPNAAGYRKVAEAIAALLRAAGAV